MGYSSEDHWDSVIPHELSPDDLSGTYRSQLRTAILTADIEDPYKDRMLELLQLREKLSHVWEAAYPQPEKPSQADAYEKQREIRALYVRLDIAEMLRDASWSVDREETISNAMGTVPLAEIERLMLHFYRDHGKLEQSGQDADKLCHLDLGCGNAVNVHRLRHNKKEPFAEEGDERAMSEYWVEFGYADRIYFTLNDLLKNALREEYRQNPAFLEFTDTVTTLLLRKIQFELAYKKSKNTRLSFQEEMLDNLASNPELIKIILPNLNQYIRKLARVNWHVDDEYFQDEPKPISDDCKTLIEEYFRDPATFAESHFDLNRQIEKEITIYPHNVILGTFKFFRQVVPEVPAFHLVHSFRATSHADDGMYQDLVGQVARRLKPGGIFLDDGKKESYTRYERINELLALQEELGSEYKITVIDDGVGPRSVAIERALKSEGGEEASFFLDEYEDQVLLEDFQRYSIQEFPGRHPRIMFRNEMISRLRNYLIEEDTAAENEARALSSGKMAFREVYKAEDDRLGEPNVVERILNEYIFSDPKWQAIEERKIHPEDEVYQLLIEKAFALIRMENPVVAEAVELDRCGALPANPGKTVKTFSINPKKGALEMTREIRVLTLPRNRDIPTLENPFLERERQRLVENLKILYVILGIPPLRLLEFKNCFTNPMMVSALSRVLNQSESLDQTALAANPYLYISPYVSIEKIDLQDRRFPKQEKGLHIIGGSLNDSYDEYGQAFVKSFSCELLERIKRGELVTALGICFGSQSLLEAYGKISQRQFSTTKGALQFGSFPIVCPNIGEDPLKHLAGKSCSVAMTRSGYSILPGYSDIEDMKPLAFEGKWNEAEEKWEPDIALPPVAFSLMNGAVVTSQFHPEIRFTDERHLKILRRYLKRTSRRTRESFGLEDFGDYRSLGGQDAIFNHNVNLIGRGKSGEVEKWLKKDIEMAWLIPTLNSQAERLLSQLNG